MLESCVYKMLVCWGLLGERGDVDGWGFLEKGGCAWYTFIDVENIGDVLGKWILVFL